MAAALRQPPRRPAGAADRHRGPRCAPSPTSAARLPTRSIAARRCCARRRSTLRGVRADADRRAARCCARPAPAAKPLARVLRLLPSTARRSIPVVRDLRTALPDLRTLLRELPALDAAAQPALRSLVLAVRDLLPILPGLRPYAPDVVAGVIQGFGGATERHLRRQRPLRSGSARSAAPAALPASRPAIPSGGDAARADRALPGRRARARSRRLEPVDPGFSRIDLRPGAQPPMSRSLATRPHALHPGRPGGGGRRRRHRRRAPDRPRRQPAEHVQGRRGLRHREGHDPRPAA